jgi:hypothetical protein
LARINRPSSAGEVGRWPAEMVGLSLGQRIAGCPNPAVKLAISGNRSMQTTNRAYPILDVGYFLPDASNSCPNTMLDRVAKTIQLLPRCYRRGLTATDTFPSAWTDTVGLASGVPPILLPCRLNPPPTPVVPPFLNRARLRRIPAGALAMPSHIPALKHPQVDARHLVGLINCDNFNNDNRNSGLWMFGNEIPF